MQRTGDAFGRFGRVRRLLGLARRLIWLSQDRRRGRAYWWWHGRCRWNLRRWSAGLLWLTRPQGGSWRSRFLRLIGCRDYVEHNPIIDIQKAIDRSLDLLCRDCQIDPQL